MKYLILPILFLLTHTAIAQTTFAGMYFTYPAEPLAHQSEFAVPVFIESSEPVNAFSVTVFYSSDELEFVGARTNDSLVDVWTKGPEGAAVGVIALEGGMQSPFVGTGGTITELIFRTKVSHGEGRITLREPTLYKADGQGTALAVPSQTALVTISEDGLLVVRDDSATPETLTFSDVFVSKNPVDGVPIAAFRVTGGSDAVPRVETRFFRWFLWSDWMPTENPVRFNNNIWMLELRATDTAGNSATHTVWITRGTLSLALIIVVFLFLCVMGIKLFHTQKRSATMNT